MLYFSTQSLASSSHGWYIKRNGRGRPGFPEDAELLEDYNCYYIDRNANSRKIYLTFDAGYENGNVSRILDTLRDEKVPAAFFLLDNIILKNTDLVKRMSDEGHLVCNHTLRHRDLSKSDYDEISKDLCALEEIYFNATGRVMAKYFRFPEGKYSIDAVKHIDQLGYKTIFWSFAYEDWNNEKQPAPDKAMKKILDNTHDGAVMLFHPTSSTNADIFEELIKAWREMGYTFGTLDELTR
jgi:peptidoglycan-N-acetylmuramic acid deacetylase